MFLIKISFYLLPLARHVSHVYTLLAGCDFSASIIVLCNNFFYRFNGRSDLPDDRSTVLLLGVTRIPTTPTAARRPCSLPLSTTTHSFNPVPHQNNSVIKKNSFASRHYKGAIVRRNSSGSRKERHNQAGGSSYAQNNNSSNTCNNNKRVIFDSSQNSSTDLNSTTASPDLDVNSSSTSDKRCSSSVSGSEEITPSNVNTSDFTPGPMMDRSVDSIGACSLDADASVDLTGTFRNGFWV